MRQPPFGGLFDGLGRPQSDATRRILAWDYRPESRESTNRVFGVLDRVMEASTVEGYTFLSTIELDLEPGRFPDVLSNFVADLALDRRFYVAPMREYGMPGRLTFEAFPGEIERLLGPRMGAGLWVWGLQVRTEAVGEAIECPLPWPEPSTESDRARLSALSRIAWLATQDLDGLATWCGNDCPLEVCSRMTSLK